MRIKLSKKRLFIFFLLLPFVKPPGVSEIGLISKIFDVLFIISCTVILYLLTKNKYKFSSFIKINFILQLYLFIRTFVVCGFSSSVFRNTIGVLFAVILLDYYLIKDEWNTLIVLVELLVILSVMNVLLGNGKVFETYLFGQRTNLTDIGLPMIYIAIFLYYRYKDDYLLRKKLVVPICLIILCNTFLIIIEKVSTSMLGIACIFIFFMLIKNTDLRRIKPRVWIVLFVVFNFIMVIIQDFSIFKFIIEDILGESMTLTGRFEIWKNAMIGFLNEPIWGYGYRQIIVARGDYATSTAYVHNNFLQFCVDGGLVAITLFIIMIIKCFGSKKISNHIVLGLACVLSAEVAMISEVLTSYNYIFFLLVLINYYRYNTNKVEG